METLAVSMHSARLDIKLEKQSDMYGVDGYMALF